MLDKHGFSFMAVENITQLGIETAWHIDNSATGEMGRHGSI